MWQIAVKRLCTPTCTHNKHTSVINLISLIFIFFIAKLVGRILYMCFLVFFILLLCAQKQDRELKREKEKDTKNIIFFIGPSKTPNMVSINRLEWKHLLKKQQTQWFYDFLCVCKIIMIIKSIRRSKIFKIDKKSFKKFCLLKYFYSFNLSFLVVKIM